MDNNFKEMFLENIRQKLETNKNVSDTHITPEQVLAAVKALEYCAQDIETAAQAIVERNYLTSLKDAIGLVHFTHDAFLFERYAYHWFDSLREITSIYPIELDYTIR